MVATTKKEINGMGKPRKTTNLDMKKAMKPDIMTIKTEMNRHDITNLYRRTYPERAD